MRYFKVLICLLLVCGCVPSAQKSPALNPTSPGDFDLGMTIEDFKLRNTGLSIYKAIADTVIYTRMEDSGEYNEIGYIFFNGKLFSVKRLTKDSQSKVIIND